MEAYLRDFVKEGDAFEGCRPWLRIWSKIKNVFDDFFKIMRNFMLTL